MLSPAECLNPEAIESAKAYVHTLLHRNSITQTTLPFSSSYANSKSLDTDAQLANCLIEILLRMEESEKRVKEMGERWEVLNEELREMKGKLVPCSSLTFSSVGDDQVHVGARDCYPSNDTNQVEVSPFCRNLMG